MSRQSMLKNRAAYVLWLIVGVLAVVATGGVKSPALDIVVEQLDVIGPRQWVGLLTGALTAGWARQIAGTGADQIRAPGPHPAGLAPANDNSPSDKLARAS
jgi:hypothetical protein